MSYSGIPQKNHVSLTGLSIFAFCLGWNSLIDVNKEIPCDNLMCMTCNWARLDRSQQLRLIQIQNEARD